MLDVLKTTDLAHIEDERQFIGVEALGFTRDQAELIVEVGRRHGILAGLMQMAAKGKLDWEDLLQTVYRVCAHDDERITRIRLFSLSVNDFIVGFCEMIK